MDPHPARRPGHHVRVAAVAPAVLLHQAEAYVDSVWLMIANREQGVREDDGKEEEHTHELETWIGAA